MQKYKKNILFFLFFQLVTILNIQSENSVTEYKENKKELKNISCSNPISRNKLTIKIKNQENIDNVCTRNIKDFSNLFLGNPYKLSAYKPDLSSWDVSNGENFRGMFFSFKDFNSDISNWNVSNATDFSYMFSGASEFNQNISNWDVSKGKYFDSMLKMLKNLIRI